MPLWRAPAPRFVRPASCVQPYMQPWIAGKSEVVNTHACGFDACLRGTWGYLYHSMYDLNVSLQVKHWIHKPTSTLAASLVILSDNFLSLALRCFMSSLSLMSLRSNSLKVSSAFSSCAWISACSAASLLYLRCHCRQIADLAARATSAWFAFQ